MPLKKVFFEKKGLPPMSSAAYETLKRRSWCVYMLSCGDGSLYTGSTNDLQKRLKNHEEGKASRYTRSHLPISLVYVEKCSGRSQALKREAEIKNFPKKKKQELVDKGL